MLYVSAMRWLADQGFDPVYGARPLKRVIQRELQNPLAGLILEGRIVDGETVKVAAGEGGLAIAGQMAKAAEERGPRGASAAPRGIGRGPPVGHRHSLRR